MSTQTGAPEDEIEVTPEMIAAGMDEVFEISEKEVARVYRAMEAVRRKHRQPGTQAETGSAG